MDSHLVKEFPLCNSQYLETVISDSVNILGFQIFTAVKIHIVVFRIMTVSSQIRGFTGAFCILLLHTLKTAWCHDPEDHNKDLLILFFFVSFGSYPRQYQNLLACCIGMEININKTIICSFI
jgi:hypothetical protein